LEIVKESELVSWKLPKFSEIGTLIHPWYLVLWASYSEVFKIVKYLQNLCL